MATRETEIKANETNANEAETHDPCGWRREGRDLMRAVAGGAIIGMPLLFTMEMWWHGAALSEWHLLALLGAILALNFVFDLLSGFREEYSVASALSEAVTSVGIGLVLSAIVLALIGELGRQTSWVEKIGKVLIEATVVSIGVSFANSQFRRQSRLGDDEENSGEARDERDAERLQLRADLKDIGATVAGATVFALSVAPTEEVLMIAARLSPLQQLALLAFSMLLCYIILYASGFEQQPVHVETVFQKPLAETVMACALSLIMAFVLLLLLGQRQAMSDPAFAVAATVTLGLPAIVGGAAGRLVA